MIRFAVALLLCTGCTLDVRPIIAPPVHSAFADEDGGVSASVAALTGPYNYTYVNSNNGAALGNDDRWLAGIRCWAMSQHANNGHNFWTCEHTTDSAVSCYHQGSLPASGATSIYLDQCTNSSPWSCKMHISNDWQCACQKPVMGTMSWSPTAPTGEIRNYAFDDGTVGSCSAEVGNGLFQVWTP